VLALMLVWAARDGGYESTSWLLGAAAVVVVAAWPRFVFGPGRALGRRGRLALAALTLYVAWSYASVLWATDKGAAMLGSDRALLYVVAFALFASLSWTARRLELALLAYVLGVDALALLTVIKVALGPAPQLLQGGQLAAGLGYHNATAALGTIGALGSILLAASRRHRPATWALLGAGATACLEVSLLAQSRGWLYTLPLVVVLVLAAAPRRGLLLGAALAPAAATAASLPWMIHGVSPAAGRAGLIATIAGGGGSLLVARLRARYVLSPSGRRAARVAGRALAAVGAVVVLGASTMLISSGAAARGWHQFTTNAHVAAVGTKRFTDLGSGRYDFWRVALSGFSAHPIGGLGQDNFAQSYVAARQTDEEPSWIHSLELRLLTHTGAVGFMLFAAFVVLALAAWRLAARGAEHRPRIVLAAALIPAVVWLVHGSVDWFWEIPGLSVPMFAFLGAAVALEPDRQPTATTRAIVPLAGVGAALALFGSAYVGERALQDGRALAAAKPRAALHELSVAGSLEPLSGAPQAVAAEIESRSGHDAAALYQAASGLRRDPGDWVLWLEDGLANGAVGRASQERAALDRATALDPREPVIALAKRRAGTPHPLTINEAAAMFFSRAQARVAP
jgi:hypothetical protein